MNIAYQCLERRNLLAGDLVAGDANGDYYFDSADFVQAMQSGLYETDQAATWELGDWSGDGMFTSRDLVVAFTVGTYERGAYDDEAGEPLNSATPFSTSGTADVTVYYDDTNGTLIAHAHAGSITALEIRSQSEQLATDGPINGRGLFDVEKASHVFRLEPSGPTTIYLDSALPTGLSLAELQEDLLVDGAMLIGGGLGNVRLSSIENLPVDVAYGNGERATPTGNGGRSFVDVNHANVILAYNPSTGDITITSQGVNVTTIELLSNDGIFLSDGGGVEQLFDVTRPNKIFRLRPNGASVIELPAVAQTGLTPEQVANDVSFSGAMHGGVTMNMGFVYEGENGAAAVPGVPTCQGMTTNGAVLGDANLDGVFNSSDLVTVFQRGVYEDDTTGNADWMSGDWNCDGEFDSADLVAAFEAGGYVAAATSSDGTLLSNKQLTDFAARVQDLNQQNGNERKVMEQAQVADLVFAGQGTRSWSRTI